MELALTNARQCLDQEERYPAGEHFPEEIIPFADGTAFVKAGLYGSPGYRDAHGRFQPSGVLQYYRYWQYQPGPVSGSLACKEIDFRDYPPPELTASTDEERILEVAVLADESCRNWTRVWREGGVFLHTESMLSTHSDGSRRYSHKFGIGEVRPTTDEFALVFIDHQQQVEHRQLGGRGWNPNPRYLIYSVTDNTCQETEYSRQAWEAWPAILPTPTP